MLGLLIARNIKLRPTAAASPLLNWQRDAGCSVLAHLGIYNAKSTNAKSQSCKSAIRTFGAALLTLTLFYTSDTHNRHHVAASTQQDRAEQPFASQALGDRDTDRDRAV